MRLYAYIVFHNKLTILERYGINMSNFNIINESAMPDYIKAYGELFPVEEAYFGKTKNLQEAENIFNEIWMKCFGKLEVPSEYDIVAMAKGLTKFAELTSPASDYMKRIRQCFKKEFGFGAFFLVFNNFVYGSDYVADGGVQKYRDIFNYPTRVMQLLNTDNYHLMVPNAYTLSGGVIKRMISGNSMNRLTPIETGSNDRYYDKHHTYTCHVCVYSAIIATRGFTPGMLMATILHEIGHNFVCTPVYNIDQYFPMLKWITDIYSLSKNPDEQFKYIKNLLIDWLAETTASLTDGIFGEIVSNIYGLLMKFGPISQLVTGTQLVFKTYDRVVMGLAHLFLPIHLINAIPINPITFIHNALKSMPGYSNEVFADTFATAYGYGPDVVKLQNMLGGANTQNDKYCSWLASDNNPFSIFWRVSAIMVDVCCLVASTDPHPTAQSRMAEQMLKLKADIKSSKLSPDLKKAAMHDLKECEKAYEEYLNADENDRLIPVLTWWRHVSDSIDDGRDLRSRLNEFLNMGMHRA